MSNCSHCDLPIPPDAHYQVEIDGEPREMCCPGCQAVATAIVENGLTDFYKYRTEKSRNPQSMDDLYATLSLYDKPELMVAAETLVKIK